MGAGRLGVTHAADLAPRLHRRRHRAGQHVLRARGRPGPHRAGAVRAGHQHRCGRHPHLAATPIADLQGAEEDHPAGGWSLIVPARGEAVFTARLVLDGRHLQHGHDPGIEDEQRQPPRWLPEVGLITSPRKARSPLSSLPPCRAGLGHDRGPGHPGAQTPGTIALGLLGTGVAYRLRLPLDVVSLVSAFEEPLEGEPGRSGIDRRHGHGRSPARGCHHRLPGTEGPGQDPGRRPHLLRPGRPEPGRPRGDPLRRAHRHQCRRQERLPGLHNRRRGGHRCLRRPDLPVEEPACTLIPSTDPAQAPSLTTVVLGTNVIVLTVPALLAGLSGASTRFGYKVYTTLDDDGQIDMSPDHTFDLGKPGLLFEGTGYLGTAATQPLYEDTSPGAPSARSTLPP
ncbi:MAG: hypothetical protein MZV64_25205 [Ignavibacteriales bacterium]|nr:hypothetical protein [Ignavibacteriales bacterium]